jgi:adenylylsulfate kinase
MKETKQRSVTKAISYRLGATIATFVLAFVFTQSLEIATSIGLLDFVVKFMIYYLNERVWTLINWGYKKETPIDLQLKKEGNATASYTA